MKTLMFVALVMAGGLAYQPLPTRHEVKMSEFQFKPAEISVHSGDTIVWVNHDIVPHTAHADDKSWNTGHIAGKGRQVQVAQKKGRHAFTCLYHANMKGVLIVR